MKEQILESYFGSDYYLLKSRDDLQYILRAMDEYAAHAFTAGRSKMSFDKFLEETKNKHEITCTGQQH